jgi:hypothetical protein
MEMGGEGRKVLGTEWVYDCEGCYGEEGSKRMVARNFILVVAMTMKEECLMERVL